MDHSCPTPPHQVGYRRTKYWHNLPGGGVGQETKGGGLGSRSHLWPFWLKAYGYGMSFLFFPPTRTLQFVLGTPPFCVILLLNG